MYGADMYILYIQLPSIFFLITWQTLSLQTKFPIGNRQSETVLMTHIVFQKREEKALEEKDLCE